MTITTPPLSTTPPPPSVTPPAKELSNMELFTTPKAVEKKGSPSSPKKKKKKKKNSKKRCFQGNVKLALIERQLTCKCNRNFCRKHRHAVEKFKDNGHECLFNYREEYKQKLHKDIGECKIVNWQMDKL